jgi:uncharacterized C2H2 Zn-finger protein
VHHIDRENEDPALREVLSRRPEGLARGRRLWGGYLENLDRTEMGKSCSSPIAAPHPQQKDQLRSFLEAYENMDKEVVQEWAVGSTQIEFMKDALMEGFVDQPILDESGNNMQMDVNDTIDPRLLEAHPSTSYPYSGQDGPSLITTRAQDVLPDIQYDNAAEDTEMSEAEIAEPSRVRNLSYPQTSLSSTTKGQYYCSHCPQVFPTRGKRKRHERQHTKPARCHDPGCGRAFAEQKDLVRHQRSMHSHRDEREACAHAGCDGSFTRRDSLLRHIRKQHGSNDSHGS